MTWVRHREVEGRDAADSCGVGEQIEEAELGSHEPRGYTRQGIRGVEQGGGNAGELEEFDRQHRCGRPQGDV